MTYFLSGLGVTEADLRVQAHFGFAFCGLPFSRRAGDVVNTVHAAA
jgi:hypothetical protein